MIKNSYIIEKIPTELIEYAMMDSDGIPRIRTSNTIANGIIESQFFYKKLNSEKIRKLYKGNYIQLWKENYEILKNIIPLNDIYCIVENENGEIYEFSKSISGDKFLSGGTIQSWKDLEGLYLKILNYINRIIQYQKTSKKLIGIETAIWNFTIDGKLFDLDPPRFLKDKEDSSFTRKDDINQCKRTIYRNFTEIGMKTNLLATVIIGLQDGNFFIPDLPTYWIEKLTKHLIQSIEDNNRRQKVKEILSKKGNFKSNFTKHPIDIILEAKNKEILGGINMEKCNKEQQFIFVTGPSESGKSGGINHIKAKYKQVKHLKIRDIFPEVYRDSKSSHMMNGMIVNQKKILKVFGIDIFKRQKK